MPRDAKYYESLANRYEALADTMTTERDRETIASVAAQYYKRAAEARRGERGAPELP